jgi:hypothetical protein
MTITVIDRERDGETEDLLSLVPDTELDVGDRTTVTETEQVDFCVDSQSTTTVNAEANPPAGSPCFDTANYTLTTLAPCKVRGEVFCTTGEGILCGDLLPPVDLNDCNISAIFRYSVSNIGTNNFTIITADIFVNINEPVSILGSFPITEVAPNEEVFGTVEQDINICGNGDFTVTFEVVAITDAGSECSDTDVFQFIPPSVSSPTPPLTPTPPGPTPPAPTRGGEGTLSPVNPGEIP